MKNHDVIILGAGLSGLACALTLQRSGVNALLVEPEDLVGGRVRSHSTPSGFIIDKGFQVLLSSYPELETFVDLSKLNLQKFNSGALIFNGESLDLLANPVVHPNHIGSAFSMDYTSTKDKALVLKLILTAQFQRDDFPLGKRSTLTYLQDFGFSESFIEFFWRPFLAGVYLDSQLALGENFFKFLIRCFASGNVSLPENGIAQLPLQMSAQLPKESLLLQESAQSWTSNEVHLKSGKKLSAKQVICTFDPASSATTTKTPKSTYLAVETIYFTSPQLKEIPWGKWLVLVPQKLGLGINHFCLLSAVAPTYSKGDPLLSVSVIGNKNLPLSQIQNEINQIAKQDLKLELIERVVVEKALPQMSGGSEGFKVIDDVVYCGDRWASPSINGALRSGRMAAEYVSKKLKPAL